MLPIAAEDAGTRIDAFLAARLEVSRARAQKILETATVNGKTVKPSYSLREGDELIYIVPEVEVVVEPVYRAEDVALPPILFEDEHLLVLNKPRGLTVHAGAGETGATLVDILRAHGRPLSAVGPVERAGIVHRLDKDTSGLIIVAKTDAAHWKLAADFEARQVQKTYEALVNAIPPLRGRIEAPIARSHSNRKKMTVSPEGRPSVTEYAVERKWERFAWLSINLLTGRTHQIRVHLAYIHHPVVGDTVYGGFYRALDNAPNPAVKTAIETLGGQALHARRLAFEHPITAERLEFEAPLPEEIENILKALDGEA